MALDAEFVSVQEEKNFIGDSGENSEGPHLHFEMRDANQKPVNPLQWDLAIFDSRPPEVGRLWIVPVDARGLENREAVVNWRRILTATVSTKKVFQRHIDVMDMMACETDARRQRNKDIAET